MKRTAKKVETLIESALKDSELRYRRLFEATQDGILILDAKTGMIEDVNPFLIKMLGYSREELIEKKLWEVGAFKDIEASQNAFEALQENEYIRYEDMPLRAKDGRLIQVEFVSNVYLVGGEKVIQCNIRDITEHRQLIVALQENEKKYHDLVNQSPDGFFIVGLSGNLLTVNKAMCKELAFSEKELLSMSIWDIIPEQYLDQHRKRLTKILEGKSLKEATEYAVRGKDGKIHYVEVLSAPHYSGKDIIGFQGIAHDITELKRAEQEIANLAKFPSENPDPVLRLSRDGIVMYANAASGALLGMWGCAVGGSVPQFWRDLAAQALASRENKIVDIACDGKVYSMFVTPVAEPGYLNLYGRDITEQKRAAEASRESDAKYRGLVAEINDGIFITDDRGALIFVNPALARIHGFEHPDQLVGRTFMEFIAPSKLNEVARYFKQVVEGEQPQLAITIELVRPDGTQAVVEVKASARQDGGKVVGTQGVVRDITERKQAEEALQKEKGRAQQYLDIAGVMFLVLAADQKVILINKKGCEILGYVEQEIVGRSWFDFLPQDEKDRAGATFDQLMAGEIEPVEYFENPVLTKSGQERLVAWHNSVLTDDAGRIIGIVSSGEDITERKRAEEALRNSEIKLRSLFAAMLDVIIVYDADGRYLEIAPTNPTNLYRPLDDMLGKTVTELLPPDRASFFLDLIRQTLKTGQITNAEYSLSFGGQVRWFSASVSPLSSNSVIWVAHDITHRKGAEERIRRQLEHLTALSAIDRFITANFDLKLSLSEILTHVTIELGIDAADILILNSNSQMLEFGAERGFRTKAVRKTQVHLGESYAGRAALERQLVQIPNLRDETDNLFSTTLLTGEGFVCYYGVPLIVKGQVKGVLEVFHRTALEPDAEWFDFLNALAGQAAIAIENSTLFESQQRSNSELTLAYDATIEGWSHALDLRDKETEGHTQRVTEMTVKLARVFGVSEAELVQVRWGALLHDIGKLGVPDGILLKPSPLTDEEWVAMKKHPTFAYELLSPIRYLRLALDIPYCHHEKWDGTGYPQGLKGTQIPLVARIFAVVDVWDALTSDRPYRPAWPKEKVREHIRTSSGTHFDPQVVDGFMQIPN